MEPNARASEQPQPPWRTDRNLLNRIAKRNHGFKRCALVRAPPRRTIPPGQRIKTIFLVPE
jgi:hypothetical protein